MAKSQLPTNYIKHKSLSRKLFIAYFYKTLFALIKPLEPNNILDAGCGEGFTLNKLTEHHIGKTLKGIDNSIEAIALAKKHFPNLATKVASIYKLPYQTNSFDLVLSTEVLEHLEKPEEALEEIKRVSKKYVLLSVPNDPLYRASRMLSGVEIKRLGDHPEHLNHWTPNTFVKFVHSQGLKIIERRLPFPWIIVLAEKR